jgi:hypothetical protein
MACYRWNEGYNDSFSLTQILGTILGDCLRDSLLNATMNSQRNRLVKNLGKVINKCEDECQAEFYVTRLDASFIASWKFATALASKLSNWSYLLQRICKSWLKLFLNSKR